MILSHGDIETLIGGYAGLRMTAEEYYVLADDGNRYELIDGVVHMSPSPGADHQLVASVIFTQLSSHVIANGLGIVLCETGIRFDLDDSGKALIYRPELSFFDSDRVLKVRRRISVVPTLVVEVMSPDSRALDSVTKFNDYERAGVQEYWLIDLPKEKMAFFILRDGKFVEAPTTESQYRSQAVTGFALDLDLVRRSFHMLGD